MGKKDKEKTRGQQGNEGDYAHQEAAYEDGDQGHQQYNGNGRGNGEGYQSYGGGDGGYGSGYGGGEGGTVHDAAVPKERRSRVEPETFQYLSEVHAHYKTLGEAEEKELLVGNVLEEIRGKEVRVCSDAPCSHMLESLLQGATPVQLVEFLGRFGDDNEALFRLASTAFGSHVAEKAMDLLHRRFDSLNHSEYETAQETIGRLVTALLDYLYDYVSDKFATHVARRLVVLVSGRNVLPANKQQDKKQKTAAEFLQAGDAPPPDGALALTAGGKGPKGPSSLALRTQVGGSAAGGLPPVRFPSLLRRFVSALAHSEYISSMQEMLDNPYASPFVQCVLGACTGDHEALLQLVPLILGAKPAADAGDGDRLEGATVHHVHKLMKEGGSSHLMEAVLANLPPALAAEFHSRFLQGRLIGLSSHHCANFVVQAALAGATSSQQVSNMFGELSGQMPDLLKRRRSGVVASLIAACARTRTCEAQAADALASALCSLPQRSSKEQAAVLAPALLGLDTASSIGRNESGDDRVKLSAPGCALLITVLRLPKDVAQPYVDSVLALGQNDLQKVGKDAGGSRALEALLDGAAPTASKRALLQRLASCAAGIAATAPGSFLVEKAFSKGDAGVKEAIAGELAKRVKELQNTQRGAALLSTVGVEAFTRNIEEWRNRAATASRVLEQFASMFGDDDSGKKSKSKKKSANEEEDNKVQGKQAAGKAATATAAPAAAADGRKEEKASKKDKKDKKKREEAAGVGQNDDGRAAEVAAAALGGKAADDVLALLGFGTAAGGASSSAPAVALEGGKKRKKQHDGADGDENSGAAGKGGSKKEGKKAKGETDAKHSAAAEIDALFAGGGKAGKKHKAK